MAYATIILENPLTGEVKAAPLGIAWTVFFFGPWPAIFRGDWKWFFIMLCLAVLTLGISSFVFMFIYNKMYLKDLIGSGFKAKSNGPFIDRAAGEIGMKIPILSNEDSGIS